jgi:dCMP deaminase
MANQDALDICYMACARAHAKLSKAKRKQVGAVLVTPAGNIIPGVNGLPKQLGNECETYNSDLSDGTLLSQMSCYVTKPEVIHAELNCILKAAEEGISIKGSTLYVTLSPCSPCASMAIRAGIKRVVYEEKYRDPTGIGTLLLAGVPTKQFIQGETHVSN